ncbi:CBS domain-containing protein [Eisenibacter elegans]|jgi:CBS domain-containing protein|uniref:CBS domain-containing protein n=1 Tax=Eisenibacter elegans TaxID=997 RepID=UPI000479CDBA|nr:CBS domain-containing protein [Eisenibacter elegans]
MIAQDLINQIISPLRPSDTVQKAIDTLEDMRVNHLPVVDQDRYQGLISEEIALGYPTPEDSLDKVMWLYPDVYALANQHFYDILKIASNHKMDVVAVVDEEQQYLGVVTVNDTLTAFAGSMALQEVGGILVLTMHHRDYSLAEISRLVESNNAKILSTYISQNTHDPQHINVTLKINQADLSRVIATFERFDYQIIAKYHAAEHSDLEKERIGLLLKYLDL